MAFDMKPHTDGREVFMRAIGFPPCHDYYYIGHYEKGTIEYLLYCEGMYSAMLDYMEGRLK